MKMQEDILTTYHDYLPLALSKVQWRLHPLDQALLLFDRDSGLNVIMEGVETAHLTRQAPRTLLIAVTNSCNLSCPFCYRELQASSLWTYDSLLGFCQQASDWGVLEVAFGGGEPMLFPKWGSFICELYDKTNLAINFTTNGTRLTENFLHSIEGKYGEIRLSLYDNNNYATSIALLVKHKVRFGVNWMVTPENLTKIANQFNHLFAMGVRDFLFIGYKGMDRSLHLNQALANEFASFINRTYERLNNRIKIKIDVCWGNLLPNLPHLFEQNDCGAGLDLLSITSDKHIKPCSFHHIKRPFQSLDDVKHYWETTRHHQYDAAIDGCGRLSYRSKK
jgi:MoaA/NifB/PqqE/SkfB family radical SAM enzyme